MCWIGFSWLEMTIPFLLISLRRFIHLSFLFSVFLQRKRIELIPPEKHRSHSTSCWKTDPYNVTSSRDIAYACFACLSSSYSNAWAEEHIWREEKWEMGKTTQSTISWGVYKSYRKSVIFIIAWGALTWFPLQLSIFKYR